MKLCQDLEMDRETCQDTLSKARDLSSEEERDRLCTISDVDENGYHRVSFIHYENGFVMDVRPFNVSIRYVDGRPRYMSDFDLEGTCPPSPILLILKGLFVREKMLDHIVAFAYFCDRQARKYAANRVTTCVAYAIHAAYDDHASYAALDADHAATISADAADDAYYAAHVARKEQYEFLVSLLNGTRWEVLRHE